MAIFQYFRGYFKKVSLGNVKVGAFQAKFGQELKFGILIKIRIVWVVFETSRNLRNFASPDSGKMAIFQYFRRYLKKVALGNVKVELFSPNLVRNSNLAFGLKKDSLGSI